MRIITWETKVASRRQNKKLIVFSMIGFITFCLLESTIEDYVFWEIHLAKY